MTDTSYVDLERLFNPRAIAVVGASTKRGVTWDSGNAYINGCLRQSFGGRIFPVHPKAKSILGFPCYRSVRDIQAPLDLAIICIPAAVVKAVIADCASKGVRFVHMLTAGFGETGQEEAGEIEKEITAMAKEAGMRIVGPNCMGLYCPEGGLAWNGDLPDKPGSVGLFSQSGQLANMIVRAGALEGIHFSKVVSFGNACDLQAHDFLNYLARDPATDVIACYLEGLKEGRAFLEAARSTALKKPLVVLKGGQTEGGSRATRSHTAALAGSHQTWRGMCRQAGIIAVDSLTEMVHTLSALKRLPLPKGTNAAILGGAGGGSVTMTDMAEKHGIGVPQLSDETVERLGAVVPVQGSSVKNPLDILPFLTSEDNFKFVMTLLKEDPLVDGLFFALPLPFIFHEKGRAGVDAYLNMIARARGWLEKPLFFIIEAFNTTELLLVGRAATEKMAAQQVPVFPDFEVAARVMLNLQRYRDFLRRA
ncbi:MAG: CoA-binding protein [Deltaproteobacteria bacterium]|nr:CoA-binding protein [Deltaproteobacteria bacterium]